MKYFDRTSLMVALAGLLVFAAATAKADPVGFTTSGTLSDSGNDTFTFLGGIGWTTIPSAGTDVVVGALSGTLDFNRGIIYTVNPSYTIALQVPGFIGPPGSGTTTTEGSAPMPEPAALLLLGTGIACAAGLVRRKLKAGN